jgi:hypothetical protein
MKKVFLFLLVLGALQGVSQEKKLALIVGNAAYVDGAALKNPIQDARAIDQALQLLGFETIIKENLSLSQLKRAIDDFGMRLHGYDVGLFYYAGHGIQLKGRNYLVPVDADLKIAQQIEYDCVAAERVLAFMESAKAKVNLMILDACRNNPFERSWTRSTDGGGLAFMNAPSGSLIAYATSPGSVASDGEGDHGLYTSALLKHIHTPNITVEQFFKRVRIEVEEKTEKTQTPWESTSLKGEFYFLKDTSKILYDSSRVVMAGIRSVSRGVAPSTLGRIKLLAEVPVQMGVGFEASLSHRFSLSLQAGVLRDPNSTLMMETFKAFGNDEEIVQMIEKSFKHGLVIEGGLNYNIGKSYVGVFYQQINLGSGESPASAYESQFNTDINLLAVKPGRPTLVEKSVNIQSNLSQVGILYGRRFALVNPKFEIDVEAGISKNIDSVTKVTSENREVDLFSQEVNQELDAWFARHAIIPSLMVALAFKINR